MGKNIGCMLGYSHLLHPHHLPPIYILFKFDTVSMSLKYSFFFSFSQECFMKEFSSFQERFMSKKIALAFAASCLTAVAAVVPVAASAQDLGSLTDLSSLSVSLFDSPQKQPSPSPHRLCPSQRCHHVRSARKPTMMPRWRHSVST